MLVKEGWVYLMFVAGISLGLGVGAIILRWC